MLDRGWDLGIKVREEDDGAMNTLVLFHPPTDENRELFLVGTIDALLHFAAAFTPTVPALVTADASKLAMRAVDEFVLVLVAPVAEQDGALQELLDAICLSITFYCGSLARVKEESLQLGRQGMQARVAQVIKRSAAPLIDRLLDGTGQLCPLGAVGPIAWTGLPRNLERPFIHAARLAGRAAAVTRGYCGSVVVWKGSVLCADLDATLVRVVLAHLQPESEQPPQQQQDGPPASSSSFSSSSTTASPAVPLSLSIPSLEERLGPDAQDSSPRYATPHLGSAQPAARGRSGDMMVGWVDVHVPGELMAAMAAGPVVRTARVSDQQPVPPAVTASRSAQALHPAVLWTLEIGTLGVAVLLDPLAYGGAGSSAACGAQATAVLVEALEADVRRIHHELRHGLTAWSRPGDYADTPFPAATAHPQPIFHPPGYVLHSHHHHRAPGAKLGVLPSLPADAPPSYNHLIYDRSARTAKGGLVHRSVDLDSRFLSGVALGHELFTVPPGGQPISQIVLRDHSGVLVARNVFGTETYVHAYAFPSYAAIETYSSNPEVHARNYLRADHNMMML